MIFTTNNNVLVDNIEIQPALMCEQRKAEKTIPNENNLINANIASFGDEIGKITNRVTSMFDVRAQFDKNSEEYRILDYRIKCGQLYQQNAIDRTKGIIAKPMPPEWYDAGRIRRSSDLSDGQKALYLRIVADRKPYFMKYVYDDLRKKYNDYQKNAAKNAKRRFRRDVDDMLDDTLELSEDEANFVEYYNKRQPLGMHDCTMNVICAAIEREQSDINNDMPTEFDYTIYQSGATYSPYAYKVIKENVKAYNDCVTEINASGLDDEEIEDAKSVAVEDFRRSCLSVCSNEKVLVDALVEICYKEGGTKDFLWSLFGDVIVGNLLEKNGGALNYVTRDDAGEIYYAGYRFTAKRKEIICSEKYCAE